MDLYSFLCYPSTASVAYGSLLGHTFWHGFQQKPAISYMRELNFRKTAALCYMFAITHQHSNIM